jgi:tetratricopeptide (TPR) repeat protein
MTTQADDGLPLISPADQEELTRLVNALALSDRTLTVFAIAPESAPDHPVVEHLIAQLGELDEPFQRDNFFYSEDSLYNYLHRLDGADLLQSRGRRLIMAFGLDQLDTPRIVREMKQLNLGREAIFSRNLVLIFWLNHAKFLTEFRDRAPDFWDWRGNVVNFETHPSLNPLLYPYLEWLIAENSHLKISGVMQVNRQVDILLDQIYVALQAERRREVETVEKAEAEHLVELKMERARSSSPHNLDEPSYYDPLPLVSMPAEAATKTVVQKVDLAQALCHNQYSVILGEPGAGKTTLLRYLALHFAIAHRERQDPVRGGEGEQLGKPRLPLFFRIADYAEQLVQQPNLSIIDFLGQFYRQWEARLKNQLEAEPGTGVANLLYDKLRLGQCLVLLDGLDEVFDQESREKIVTEIEAFAAQHSANQFVVTSRIAGYRDVNLSDRFTEFTIAGMGDEQVEKFLKRWCLAIETAQQSEADEESWQRAAEAQTRDIFDAIKTNEGVKRLTSNPLLLTILALIHRNGNRLPNRRVQLYELAVQVLTEDWQLSKRLPGAPKVILKESEVVSLLAPLAYWMHQEKPSGLVSQANAEEQLAKKLGSLKRLEPESELVQQAVEQFLRKVRETTGLFVERAPGLYGFMHLTFEEYFAAREIADKIAVDEILETIRLHLEEPRWQEPILLALSYLGIHSPRQANYLVEQLLSGLEQYRPDLQRGEIKLRNSSSSDPILIWHDAEGEPTDSYRESTTLWKELTFAAQIFSQVEVNSWICSNLIEKLIVTLLRLDADEVDAIKGLIQSLRQIELFNQKGEVTERLRQVANNSNLSDEIRENAAVVMVYVACGEPGTGLSNCVHEILNNLTPPLFSALQSLVSWLGEEMTPALEATQREQIGNQTRQRALAFMTALSYVRSDHYDKAIELLLELTHQSDIHLPLINWSIAFCYAEKAEYDRAINYYQQSSEHLTSHAAQTAWLSFWINWGDCYRSHGKYEQALEAFQKALAITKEAINPQEEATLLREIGNLYQAWGKYEQAIDYQQQSLKLYQQLGREKDVANQWANLAACYLAWGKYEQALEHYQQSLEIRQDLNEQSQVASSFFQIGHIYLAWDKYEQALEHYQQSLELYQQLGREKDVANQWDWLAYCYLAGGKYKQALECHQQSLEIRQDLNEQSQVASSFFQLGHVYRVWGKYEQAIKCQQQSLEIRQDLNEQSQVASSFFQLGHVYRVWGKYEQAIKCQQQSLEIRQDLNEQSQVALSYSQLGHIYREWGKYEQALEHCQQSLEIQQDLNEQSQVALSYSQLGHIYREWGKYEQAIKCQQQSLELYQQLGREKDVANQWDWLAYCYREWDKYEQAIKCQQQSLELYQQLGREKNVANQWANLAACYREWGKYEQAIKCQQQSLEIRQGLNEQSQVALSYSQLGHIYREWGKYEQALEHCQQSLEIRQDLNEQSQVALSYSQLGHVYREWGKYEQALEHCQQSLEIRQDLNEQSQVALSYSQLGHIYREWGKYEQAIKCQQQSLELYQQLGREKDVANQWDWLAACYLAWGKYEQALEHCQQSLEIRQDLNEQSQVALSYSRLGRLHLVWGKYEQALEHCQQSLELYQQLGGEKNVANQWADLAACYHHLKNYQRAIEYYQQSCGLHQKLDQPESTARRHCQIANTQQLQAKDTSDNTVALNLLAQAKQNIQKAIQLNIAGEYKENLAYDRTVISLLHAEHLRRLSASDPSLPDLITQFEQDYRIGLTYLIDLGQTIDRANKLLDIARTYLEVPLLENLDRAEALTQEALQVFIDYNRRKQQAAARKLLGEIYLSRARHNQPDASAIASQFLKESLQTYQELGIAQEAAEVEQLLIRKE